MSSTGTHTAAWCGVLEGRPGPSPTRRKPAIKGGEIVNKDFIEGSYQTHREYVLEKIGPLVDAHLEIPDIAKDPTFKLHLVERKQVKLAKSNQQMYKHVKVVDDRPSHIRDYKDKNSSKIASSLELNSRIRMYHAGRRATNIEKSNQSMLKRMEETKPNSSLSLHATSSWYDEQKKFAETKRTCRIDPCVGHLGLSGAKKGLLPPPLTPLVDTSMSTMSRTLSATGVSGYFQDAPYSPQRSGQSIRSPKNSTTSLRLSPKNSGRSPVGAIRPQTAPEIRTSSALFFDINNTIPFDNNPPSDDNLPLDSYTPLDNNTPLKSNTPFDSDSPFGSSSDVREQDVSREDPGFNHDTSFQDTFSPLVGDRTGAGTGSGTGGKARSIRPSTVHANGTGMTHTIIHLSYTLLTHLINALYPVHALRPPLNTPYQHFLSTLPSTLSQHPLSTLSLNPSSRHPLSTQRGLTLLRSFASLMCSRGSLR